MTEHAELDRWIAERIMRWHPNNFHKCNKHILGTMCWCDNELNDLVEWYDWHPTTDIRQAFEVEIKIANEKPIEYYDALYAILNKECFKGRIKGMPSWLRSLAFAQATPLQRCRAAREALEG